MDEGMPDQHFSHSLLGALVADAASLGVHWIYDPGHIAEIAEREGEVAFVAPSKENYDGVPSYFAHGAREAGSLTQYGEVLALTVRDMIENDGVFSVESFQKAFSQHFGQGGTYRGYIDRPTKGTLANIAKGQLDPSGVDDDQLPAITRLPAILGYAKGADQKALIKACVEVTNVNDIALKGAEVVTSVLKAAQDGDEVSDALESAANAAPRPFAALLRAALDTTESSSVAYGEVTERACHLQQGLPLAFHILKNATSYRDAINRNLLAGGDSAGRSIFIGAVAAARYGVDGPEGVPLDWILSMRDNSDLWQSCRELSKLCG